MILGIDHIALASTDIASDVKALTAHGFQSTFAETDVPNPSCKLPLLAHYMPVHSLAFCRAEGQVTIELTVHGATTASPASIDFRPVLAMHDFDSEEVPDWFAAAEDDWLKIRRAEIAGRPCWQGVRRRSGPPWIIVALPDPHLAAEDWCTHLGFTHATKGPGWARASCAGAIPAWQAEMLFVKAPKGTPSTLDSAGFPCAALWSTASESDIEGFSGFVTDVIDPFDLTVNGRPLRVQIMRGRQGEILELLQIVK